MNERIPKCLACEGTATAFWYEKANEHGRFPISRCKSCGAGWVYPRPSEDALARFYEQYNRHPAELSIDALFERVLQQERDYPNSTLDAQRMVSRCRALTGGTRFLDVGAGYGFSSQAALDAGFEVTALEPSAVSRAVLEKLTHLSAEPTMLTRTFVSEHAHRFDAILLSQVLEHMVDVQGVVDQLGSMLAPGGVLCLAVPHFGSLISRIQGRRDMFITPPEHVNFFTRVGLEKLLVRRGFAVVQTDTVSRVDTQRKLARVPVGVVRATAATAARLVLSAMDATRTGMFLNVYARRAPSGNPHYR